MHESVPDAHVEGKGNPPIMLTTDMSLKMDPGFREISEGFLNDPKAFDEAFAKAWFKLTHRDLGPRARYLGKEVPSEAFVWQDPIPTIEHDLIDDSQIASLKKTILDSGLSIPELVRTAWASASTYRSSDMRGGANGARIRLAPQKDWVANNPEELTGVLGKLDTIQADFNGSNDGVQVSIADLIVLGGVAAIEQAATDAGLTVIVPFTPGRADAEQEMTDVDSFAVLEPTADAFRNYYSDESYGAPTKMLVEKANLLDLTVKEMTALVGGLRVLNANTDQAAHGVFTDKPGTLSNDFFVNLLDMSTQWAPSSDNDGHYEGTDRATGELKWTATPVDLIFGSHSELRAVAEVYASDDGADYFVEEFVNAWTKVMMGDRFDV